MPKQKKARKRLSGYQCFFQDVLKELKVQYPNSITDLSMVSSKCAETWKKLDSVIKKHFQDEAEVVNAANLGPPKPQRQPKKLGKMPKAAKKRIQDEAVNEANMLPPPPPKSQQPSNKLKKTTKKRFQGQSKMIKKPASAFIHFSKEFRCEAMRNHPDLAFGQISRVLSEMWRNADEETKLKFKRLSLEQSERYQQEMDSVKSAER